MKKQYTKKQITEAIAYWEKQLKLMNESKQNIEELSHCASMLHNAALSDDSWRYFRLKRHELEFFKDVLLPLANAGEQKQLASKFLANSSFTKFISGIGKTLFNEGTVDPDAFYFTTDAHGNKVVILCRFNDGSYLAACNGDGYETPEFYFTFYDKNGNCMNGNRSETWLDIFSLDRPRCFALKDMNTPNGASDLTSKIVEQKLVEAGFKKYVG